MTKKAYNLTFADEIDKKWPQTQYLCWIAALSFEGVKILVSMESKSF